jgi:heptosyltransferase II
MPCEILEYRSFSPWILQCPPEKILIIRLHAIGDVVATLPACGALRHMFPLARIDFLTSEAYREILRAIKLFDHIYSIAQSKGRLERACRTLIQGAQMRSERYDVILDLQRNRASRILRRAAHPHAWGEFDRFSPRHALERTIETFHKTGFPDLRPLYKLDIRAEVRDSSLRILRDHGWDERTKLVILNPAGLWATRNWPLTRYAELANLWKAIEAVRFLFVGTDRLEDKARLLSNELPGCVINLTNKTTLAEALGVIQHASIVISEDSGLLHMAWVSGIPTVALFGSTRSDWTQPMGERSRYLGSEDLPCGSCMQATCKYGDVHCLTRHSAEAVLKLARELEIGS